MGRVMRKALVMLVVVGFSGLVGQACTSVPIARIDNRAVMTIDVWAGAPLTLSGSRSIANGGTIAQYEWAAADASKITSIIKGNPDNNPNATFTFVSPATSYTTTIYLRVRNSSGVWSAPSGSPYTGWASCAVTVRSIEESGIQRYVKPAGLGGNDANDGSNPDYPCATISHALAASGNLVINLVSGTAGTPTIYTGSLNRDIPLTNLPLPRLVAIRSTDGNPANCIINCENNGRAFRVYNCDNNGIGDKSPFISGITIKNGKAVPGSVAAPTPLTNDTAGTSYACGGAVYCYQSHLAMSNCIIEDNQSDLGNDGSNGGGITTHKSNPSLRNCLFTNNSSHWGGAAYFDNSTPGIINCTFTDNTAHANAIPGSGSGGGMRAVSGSYVQVVNTIFWNNHRGTDTNQADEIALSNSRAFVRHSCVANSVSAPDIDITLDGSNPTALVDWGTPETNKYTTPNLDSDGYLMAGSNCINTGLSTVSYAGQKDIHNENRLNDVVDIGADEYYNTDGDDSLPDWWESCYNITSETGDEDNDGLTNLWEYRLGLHPRNADTDGDGITDDLEDYDGDGMPNLWEIQNATAGLDPRSNTDASGNPDNDARNNLAEYQAGTNPNHSDRRVYVNINVSGGNHDGTSWDNAYIYLQDALNAQSYDVIWVAQGTYKPDQGAGKTANNRNETFQLGNNITVYGGFQAGATSITQRNPETYKTILTGDLDNDGLDAQNSYHVVKFTANALLDGFTIKQGYANVDNDSEGCGGGIFMNQSISPVMRGCTVIDNYARKGGGGIYVWTTHPLIEGCVFENNVTDREGGAIYNSSGSQVNITRCTFYNNRALASDGGAIISSQCVVGISHCVFESNQARYGGAITNLGTLAGTIITHCAFVKNSGQDSGAVVCDGGLAQISRSQFVGNTSSLSCGFGGGITSRNNASVTVTQCSFENNQSWRGAAINFNQGTHTISRCVFKNNQATTNGGAIEAWGLNSLAIEKSVFIENVACTNGSGGAASMGGPVTISNSIFLRNSTKTSCGGALSLETNTTAQVTNCLFAENIAGSDPGSNGSGGGILINGRTSPTITQCTFYGNSAKQNGGAIASTNNTQLTLSQCVLWDNSTYYSTSDELYDYGSSNTVVSSCDIDTGSGQPPYPGTGNINIDPLFQDVLHSAGVNGIYFNQDDGLLATAPQASGMGISYGTNPGNTSAPQPNPMNWNWQPEVMVSLATAMMATEAADDSGEPVWYYFDEITGNNGGADSGWQYCPVYVNGNQSPNTTYSYVVRAVDGYGNMTANSAPAIQVQAGAGPGDTTPPTPNPMLWRQSPWGGPTATGSTITMTAEPASDNLGGTVYYQFEVFSWPAGELLFKSGWQTDRTFVHTNPIPGVHYSYWVNARDASWNQTSYSEKRESWIHTGYGELVVYLGPTDAISGGAQWSVDNINWHNSGETVSLPTRHYSVYFSEVPGWQTPATIGDVWVQDSHCISNPAGTGQYTLLANTRRIPSADYTTIGAAVTAAQTGDILLVSPGTYNETINLGSKDIILTGINPKDQAKVNATVIKSITVGSGASQYARISGVTINSNQGTGLMCNREMQIKDCQFTNNRQALILNKYNQNNSYHIDNCRFIGNTSSWESPISLNMYVRAEFDGCWFENNIVTGNGSGGAINVYNATLIVDGCTFRNNQALNGGAIYSQDSHIVILDSMFNNNVSPDFGAAGGAIHVWGGGDTNEIQIRGCAFNENSSTYQGGAISITLSGSGMQFEITDCTFNNNTSSEGAGICFGGHHVLALRDCTFINNHLIGQGTYGGGALCLVPSDPRVNMYGCYFINNQAPNQKGGAVSVCQHGNTSLNANGCIFRGNSAYNGGAIYDRSFGESSNYSNCLFYDNSAVEGGALWISVQNDWTVSSCTFVANEATLGGAMYLEAGNPQKARVIHHSILWANQATSGGEVYKGGAVYTFNDCDIEGGLNGAKFAGTLNCNGQNNMNADPIFQNASLPEGSDGIYWTTDDGLLPQTGSLAVGKGFYLIAADDQQGPQWSGSHWQQMPHALDSITIEMRANSATDINPPVEYYFKNLTVTNGLHDRYWSVDPYYKDTNLTPNTAYQYQVRVRDYYGNITDSDDLRSAITNGDSTPPTPVTMSWLSGYPCGVHAYQINAYCCEASDNSRIDYYEYEYYAEHTPATVYNEHGGQWQAIWHNLQANTVYWLRVRAVDTAGNANNWSPWASATTWQEAFGAGEVPTNLAATAVSSSRIDLTWEDHADNEDSFQVWRKPNGGSYALVATVGRNVASYADSGLTGNTTYYYQVRAYNVYPSYTNYSNEVSKTTLVATPPAAPTGLTATAASYSQINLSWNAVSGASYYRLYRDTVPGVTPDPAKRVGGDITQLTYANTGLSANTTYYYVVTAYSTTNGESSPSTPASDKTPGTPGGNAPTAPSNLTATNITSSSVPLTWTDNSNDETGFKVERSTDGGTTFPVSFNVSANQATYTDSSVQPNTTYLYRVGASNTYGTNYSTPCSATTLGTPPAAPTNITAAAISSSQINLTWSASAGAEHYHVYRSTTSPVVVNESNKVGGNITALSYSDTGLSANTLYYYVVTAYSANGESDPSTPASATTSPGAPSGLAAAAISSSQINLTWSASAGATGYHVYRSASNPVAVNESNKVGGNITALSYSDTGLSANTLYYYVVTAYSANGESGPSIQASATTLGTPPAAPANLAAAAISSSQINLTWSASAGATGYHVYRSTTNPVAVNESNKVGGNITALSYSDTGLSANTLYYYVVTAYSANGESDPSTPASATTLGTPPAAPTGLTASSVTSNSVTLTWTDNSNNEDRFKIMRKTNGGAYEYLNQVPASINTFTDSPVLTETSYTYRIFSENANGPSTTGSNELTLITAPAAPSALTVTALSNTSIRVNWTINSVNETGFEVERRNEDDTVTLFSVGADQTSYTDGSVTAYKSYVYRVRSKNSYGNSVWSAEVQAIADNDSPIPTTPLWDTPPYASSDTSITMVADNSWDNSDVEYLFECTSGGGHNSSWQESPEYTDRGLSPGGTYTYRVRVRDRSTNQNLTPNYSAVASATTISRIIYVNNEIATSGNGASWATAYKYLQDALAAATAGTSTEIWVAAGTYYTDRSNGSPNGSGSRTTTFTLKDKVSLYGGFAGGESLRQERNASTNETILSGDVGPAGGSKSYHVLDGWDSSGISNTTVIDGFTIRDGYADGGGSGGGIRLQNDSLVIANCLFIENDCSEDGAGIYISGGSPKVQNCIFEGRGLSSNVDNGSGISAWNCNQLDITNCVFSNHYTLGSGGAVFLHAATAMNVSVMGCLFENNNGYSGGGIYGEYPGLYLAVNDCVFRGNIAIRGDNCHRGGGVSLYDGQLEMSRCVFTGNLAKYGSGVYLNCNSTSIVNTIDNCIFFENTCEVTGDNYGSGIHIDAGTRADITHCVLQQNANFAIYVGSTYAVIIKDCILWDNDNPLKSISANTTVSYCDIQGCGAPSSWNLPSCTNGGSNQDLSPCFVDVAEPEGPDRDFLTADDGVVLQDYSLLRGLGSNNGNMGIDYINDNATERGCYWPRYAWKTNPYCSDATTVVMEAAGAVELTGNVQYQVEEEKQGVFSVWQTSRSFAFTGLQPDTNYSFRMRVMDTNGKIYDWSASTVVTTGVAEDIIPPAFRGPEWIDEDSLSSTSVRLAVGLAQAVGTSGPVEYLIERVTPEGMMPLGGWQDDPYFTDKGLQPNTTYYYVGHVRDIALNVRATYTLSCKTRNDNETLAVYTEGACLQWRKVGDTTWKNSGDCAYYPGTGGQTIQIQFNNDPCDTWEDQPNVSVVMSTSGTTVLQQQIVSNIQSTHIKKVGIGGNYATIMEAIAATLKEAQNPADPVRYNWDEVRIQMMAQPNPHVLKKTASFTSIKNKNKSLKIIFEADPSATTEVVVDCQSKYGFSFKAPFSGSAFRNLTLQNLPNKGIVSTSGNLLTENCNFRGCKGVVVVAGGKPTHTLTINNTEFHKFNPSDPCEVFCKDAAIKVTGSSVVIDHVTIDGCTGAGIIHSSGSFKMEGNYTNPCEVLNCAGGAISSTNPQEFILDQCIIRDNIGPKGCVVLNITKANTRARVQHCRFENNHSQNGGAINCSVGKSAGIIIDKCEFLNNQAIKNCGGSLYCKNHKLGNLVVSNCLFANNQAGTSTQCGQGGAVFVAAGGCAMSHCTVADNYAWSYGTKKGYGGAFYVKSKLDVINSVVYYNTADYGHEIALIKNAAVILKSCCMQGVDDPCSEMGHAVYIPAKGAYTYTYSDHNMKQDPCFINRDNGEYRLSETPALSPCIDYAPIYCPIYVYEGAHLYDIEDVPHNMNHPSMPLSNPSDPCQIADIGAFEIVTTAPVAPDLFSPADGAVDVSLTPTLTWQHANGASQYKVYVDGILKETVPQGTYQYLYPTPLNDNTSYTWKVEAVNSKGMASSATRSFQTLPLADIGGVVFNDLDGDGVRDGGEPVMSAGWLVFVDSNQDGLWQSGEPYDVTSGAGSYGILGLEPGTHRLAQQIPIGWRETYPAAGYHEVTVSGTDIPNLNFGSTLCPWVSPLTLSVTQAPGVETDNVVTITNYSRRVVKFTVELMDP